MCDLASSVRRPRAGLADGRPGCGQDSPFLSHDWFACCWRTAGPDRRREVWVLEDAAGPVAFLPLTRVRTRAWGFPSDSSRSWSPPTRPFVDIPMAREPAEVVPAFLRAQPGRRLGCPLARKLPLKSATLQALRTSCQTAFCRGKGGTRHRPASRSRARGRTTFGSGARGSGDVPKHREPAGEERDRIRRGTTSRPGRPPSPSHGCVPAKLEGPPRAGDGEHAGSVEVLPRVHTASQCKRMASPLGPPGGWAGARDGVSGQVERDSTRFGRTSMRRPKPCLPAPP